MTKPECLKRSVSDDDEWEFCDDEVRVREEARGERTFDLEERTAKFGEAVIEFSKKIPRGPGNDRLIGQLVGAATSVGANYCEADDAVSGKEFLVNINRCWKEACETKFFLRMIAKTEPSLKSQARAHWFEARELHLIFAAIVRRK